MDELREFSKWWKESVVGDANDKEVAEQAFLAGVSAARDFGIPRTDKTTTERFDGNGKLIDKTVVTHSYTAIT